MNDQEDLLPVAGGLKLPRILGAGASLVQQTEKRWDTLQKVQEKLREMKVPDLVEPDVVAPKITAELLLTPDTKEYTVMFANTRVWYGYATRLVARTRAALLEATNQLENLEAELRKKIREYNKLLPKADRMTSEQVADEVRTDPDWLKLKLREQELEQFKLELTAWFDDIDRQLRLVSRQVEVRREDSQGGRNEQNMPGRTHGTFSGRRVEPPR